MRNFSESADAPFVASCAVWISSLTKDHPQLFLRGENANSGVWRERGNSMITRAQGAVLANVEIRRIVAGQNKPKDRMQ